MGQFTRPNQVDPLSLLADSWKGHSALESLIKSPQSQLRRLILQILLLEGAGARSEEAVELAMKDRNLEVLKILLTWEKSGKEEGKSPSPAVDV